MRIALLYLGRRGGIAHYTAELAAALQDYCELSCHIAEGNSLREDLNRLHCSVASYPTYHSWATFASRTIALRRPLDVARALLRERPDYVLDTGTGVWGDIIYRFTRQRLRWARVVHDVVLHEDRLRGLINLQRRLFPLAADTLVALSRFSAAQLAVRYPRIPVLTSLHGVIHTGLEPDIDRIAANRKHFLFFGRIENYKGIDCLLDAFALANAADPNIRLTIAGAGRLSPGQMQVIHRLGVTLHNGWLPEATVNEVLRAAGVLILPYLTATQSGVAAAGISNAIPMIATDVGALPEQVIEGRNGRIVPVGNSVALSQSMISLANSELDARRMAKESLHLRETTFRWATISSELVKSLERAA